VNVANPPGENTMIVAVRGLVEFGELLYETLFEFPFRAESHVSDVLTCHSHSLAALLDETKKTPEPNPASTVPEVGDNVYTHACFATAVVGLVWVDPSLHAKVSPASKIGTTALIISSRCAKTLIEKHDQ
jgi:hypothetical protein